MDDRKLWVVEEELDVSGGEFGAKAWEPLDWLSYPTEKMALVGMKTWERSKERKWGGKLRVTRYVPAKEES